MGSGPISNHAYTQVWWIGGRPVVVNFYRAGNGPYYPGTGVQQ